MEKPFASVANYMAQQLALCGKTQSAVSHEIGYENPNVLTMFKQGKTKVPLNKVKVIATALEVDAIYLLKLVMKEYTPETWDVIMDIIGSPVLTESELQIINVVRQSDAGLPVEPKTNEEKAELTELVKKWAKRKEAEYELSYGQSN